MDYSYTLYLKGLPEEIPNPPEGVKLQFTSSGTSEVLLPPHPSRKLVEEVVSWLSEIAGQAPDLQIYDPQRMVTTTTVPSAEELHAATSSRGHIITDAITGDPGAYGQIEEEEDLSFMERHPTLTVLLCIVVLYMLMDFGLRLVMGCL